jgi:UDP-glucose 4-epimerase
MEARNVLVTGGAGYIGAHTVLELHQAGYNPILIDNLSRADRTLLGGLEVLLGTPPVFYEGDCCDAAFLESVFQRHHLSAVLHFAAYKSVGESVQNPLLYYRNNINSMLALLEVMQRHAVKPFIFSSSCTVYGQPDEIPVNESAPFKRAESPYGATKQMCERILEDACPGRLKIVSLRYFNPIGAHPSALLGELPLGVPGNLVPFITQTAIGKRQKLVVFGNDYNTPDGSNVRDFIHVVDLARAHVKALQFVERAASDSFFEVFNLGTGRGASVLEVVRLFEMATGQKLNYEIGPRRPGDVEKTFADPRKANSQLGWKTELSLEQALADAWRWEQKIAKR